MTDYFKHVTLSLVFTFVGALASFSSNATFHQLDTFGDNPGELSASYFKPDDSTTSLVVLLHGCVQNGQELASNTGLIGLANKYHFSVLIPQQSKSNNITSCFNWFSEKDSRKDMGETKSIKQMIDTLKQTYHFDKVYIAGLSAGGAMASAMLINYPNLFDAGAVIAGVPYPCADGLIKAISCMKNGPSSEEELIQDAKTYLENGTTLPRLIIWTGADDSIVNPQNSQALAKQWQAINQLAMKPKTTIDQGVTTKQWLNSNQTELTLISIAGIDHGITVNPTQEYGGIEGDYLLKSPIATMHETVQFFGLKTN